MRITDLHIDGFGVWSGLSISDMSPGATVVFGQNEAGKTTLLHFLRSVFYGFSPQRRQKYLPPVYGGLAGGSLYVASAHGDLEIQRHDTPQRSGEPALTDENGTVHGQSLLDQLLHNVDEPVFNNVFAIGLREIQQLGMLNDTQAAAFLYDLASGMDRVSLPEVLRELSFARRRILDEDGQASEIAKLFDDHELLSLEIEDLSANTDRWMEIAEQCKQFDQSSVETEATIKRLEREARNVELAVQVCDPWFEQCEIERQLTALGVPAHVDEDTLRQLDELNYELNRRETQLANVKSKRQATREEASALKIDNEICDNLARIEACGEHLKWISSLERQASRLDEEIQALSNELEVVCQASGVRVDDVSRAMPDLSRQTLALLEDPGRQLREASKEVKTSIRERDQIGRESDQLAVRLHTTLSRRVEGELHRSIDDVAEEVSLLRQRIQVDGRIEKLERTQEDLEIEIDDLLERQVLPVWQLIGLGVPFVLGIMLILIGMIWTTSSVIGWLLALLGAAGLVIGIVMKVKIERGLSSDLETCSVQLERVRQEVLAQAIERDELDLQLPDGEGTLDARLKIAERQLDKLEEMLPVSAELQAAEQRCNDAAIRVTDASEEHEQARRRWTDVLTAIGLPTHLEPDNVRDMKAAYEQAAVIWEKCETRRDELRQRQQDYESICERIEKLCQEVGVETETDDPKSQLRTLLNLASDQEYVLDRRKKLRLRFRKLSERGKRCNKRIRQLSRQRDEILSSAGVDSEDGLRQLIAKNEQVVDLRQKRQSAQEKIAAIVTDDDRISEVEQLLRQHETAVLESRWDEIMAEIETLQKELAQGHQQRGQWKEEMRSLGQDPRLAEARLELNCVKQKLKDAIRRWQTLATTSLLVQQMQEHFEAERQPETLRDASVYLKQITCGRYVKLYTPHDENVLRVNDRDGGKFAVDVLSQGTREAIYLSLRLALVSQFAKRQTSLPLILDDVLVNLDADRAQAAAETLCNFADQGHQLIMFTCHKHILKLFQDTGANVRQLPSHVNVAKGEGVVEELMAPAPVSEEDESDEASHIEYETDEQEESTSDSWIDPDLVAEEKSDERPEETEQDDIPVESPSAAPAKLPSLNLGAPTWWENSTTNF